MMCFEGKESLVSGRRVCLNMLEIDVCEIRGECPVYKAVMLCGVSMAEKDLKFFLSNL